MCLFLIERVIQTRLVLYLKKLIHHTVTLQHRDNNIQRLFYIDGGGGGILGGLDGSGG
jgi:hypothetical protein